MKLYDFSVAPNARRVRIFVAEKGLNIPVQEIDLYARQSRTPEFLKKNPAGQVPLLELDDGSYLAESVAICRYLEGLHPNPNLMGRDTREQAFIEMWNRRMELELFGGVDRYFQNTDPMFKGRFPQFADYAEAQRAYAVQRLARMDGELAGREFIAADRYTIADITALVAIDLFTGLAKQPFPSGLPNVKRWHDSVSSRASARA
ncbi:MAG: glutathione S-transferase family protein [Candidatus Binataceae bacterium]